MIGFFSKTPDPKAKVTKQEIYFVSAPDGLNEEELRVRFAPISKQFAEALDVNEVYLHFGKDFITYEFKV